MRNREASSSVIMVFTTLAILVACGPPPMMVEEPVDGRAPASPGSALSDIRVMLAPNSEYSTESGEPRYRVWYGTNRRPIDANDPRRGYSDERDTRINYGRAYVDVPLSHDFGSTGSSWFYRLVTLTDNRLKLRQLEASDSKRFFRDMKSKLASREHGKKDALVYVHGYRTSFEDAVIRAAQMGFDLKVNGVTALFSWPSQGSLFSYVPDEASVAASEPFLEEFLLRVMRESGAEKVHVIAHSMGNRALLQAMERVANISLAQMPGKFGQIILAAPDVDKDIFENLAQVYPTISDRTTLYISSKDLAVKASELVHDYPRAGFFPPVTRVPGIDTIIVSNIDMSVLGHGYFAEAAAVLYDMFQLLQNNAPPDRRIRLRPVPDANAPGYWEIVP